MTQEGSASGQAGAAEVIRRFHDTLRKTQFMPPERMREYQRGLLERLVRHARAHVPFYRASGRLDPLFRRDDTIDWDRWGEISILTRGEVQRAGPALHSEVLAPEHGATFSLSSSGSTGQPVSVLHSQLSRSIGWIAILLRDYERYGIDPRGRMVFFAPPLSTKSDPREISRRTGWYPQFAALGLTGERYDLTDTRPVTDLIDAVVSLCPDYLRIQPLVLELMCAQDRDWRLPRLGIRAITTVGEHLSKEVKALAKSHFGCSILDHYGSGECGRMASTCPHCNRYHVHAETVFLEVIDNSGAITSPGDLGRVIVTPLYNYAMPLIRYDLVDQARVGNSGGCPVTLPTLEEVHGKERTPFNFPGGVAIRPTLPNDAVFACLGAQAYQVAQIADDRCEFRIVPGSLPEGEMRFDQMTALLQSMWWSGLQVEYRIVDALPHKSPYGKVFQFVREMPSPPAS